MTEQEKKQKIRELEIEKQNLEDHIKIFNRLIFKQEIIDELLDKLSEVISKLEELKKE